VTHGWPLSVVPRLPREATELEERLTVTCSWPRSVVPRLPPEDTELEHRKYMGAGDEGNDKNGDVIKVKIVITGGTEGHEGFKLDVMTVITRMVTLQQ
jgi:hypothetical protein